MKFITDSKEYQLIINNNEETDELLFTLVMNQERSFWQRLRFYVKYLFGYRCLYGDFDCLSISKKDAARIMLRLRDDEK